MEEINDKTNTGPSYSLFSPDIVHETIPIVTNSSYNENKKSSSVIAFQHFMKKDKNFANLVKTEIYNLALEIEQNKMVEEVEINQ